MSQLGERLRAAREEQGISLAQAAAETRILQRYIVALEDGDYQHLPGDVYARGFIRNYAQYLDLPVEELIELYRRDRGASEPIRVVPVTSAPRVRGVFVPSFFGVFFVVLALVGLTYLALSATNRIGESAQATTPQPTTVLATQAIPTAPANPTSAPAVAAVPTAAPAAPATAEAAGGAVAPDSSSTTQPAAPIVGEVRIAPGENPGSWLNIILDGKSVFQGVLGPGRSRGFTAQRDLSIRIGNAGVVYITVNGKDQPLLGGSGEVVTFSWPPR